MKALKVFVEKKFFDENKGENGEWEVQQVAVTLIEKVSSKSEKSSFGSFSGNYHESIFKTSDGKTVRWYRYESDPIGGKYTFV